MIGSTHTPIHTHLLNFGALVPGAHLLAGSQAVHGHQADGEGQCAHYDFPRVGGHQQAVKPKQASQHGLGTSCLIPKGHRLTYGGSTVNDDQSHWRIWRSTGGKNNKTVDEQDFDKVEGRVVITTSTDAIVWTETITPLTTTQMTDDTSER